MEECHRIKSQYSQCDTTFTEVSQNKTVLKFLYAQTRSEDEGDMIGWWTRYKWVNQVGRIENLTFTIIPTIAPTRATIIFDIYWDCMTETNFWTDSFSRKCECLMQLKLWFAVNTDKVVLTLVSLVVVLRCNIQWFEQKCYVLPVLP